MMSLARSFRSFRSSRSKVFVLEHVVEDPGGLHVPFRTPPDQLDKGSKALVVAAVGVLEEPLVVPEMLVRYQRDPRICLLVGP